MEILFHDYYSTYEEINNLDNYYNGLYQYYKKYKNICMYLLKYENNILGIIIYENNNKICKIYIIDIYKKNNNIYDEFIYFIGDFLINNFYKLIFCNINNSILNKLYNLIFKYHKFKIYNLDNEITNIFETYINTTDIYIFKKYIEEERNKCCIFI